MDVAAELKSALKHHRIGHLELAETGYRRIINSAANLTEKDQKYVTEALDYLGTLVLQRGDPENAVNLLSRAIKRYNLNPRSYNNLGNAQLALGHIKLAIDSYLRAANLDPNLFDAHFNLAIAQLQAERPKEAEFSLKRALNLQPDNASAWCNLGLALQAQMKLIASRKSFEEAIRKEPALAVAHANLGAIWRELGDLEKAEAELREALRYDANLAEAHINLGDVYADTADYSRAIEAYTTTIKHKSALTEARSKLIAARLMICDWSNLKVLRNQLATLDATDLSKAVPGSNGPFLSLMLGLSPKSQRKLADNWVARINNRTSSLPRHQHQIRSSNRVLRIGYLSGDFRDHPVGHIMNGFFTLHDRNKVSVHVYSTGRNDDSPYRRSAENDADYFKDISLYSHSAAAKIIQTDGIDILVNLMGYTAGSRSEIIVQRPAPIQVSWLGYPATTGNGLMDYLICDPVAAPPEIEESFAEKMVMLPNCHIPAYSRLGIVGKKRSRADESLPENTFVFCCFNAHYKIEPDIFECWMNILHQNPNSVLWLRGGQAESLLIKNAKKLGINEERLVFSRQRLDRSSHIARHSLADLFLDTHYYSAHATALDALTAGLPILCCPGPSLAGRATASMLTTLGLDDLVSPDLESYTDTAVRLSLDWCHSLKTRLSQAQNEGPFFNRKLFVQNLESAFYLITTRTESSLPTKRLVVTPSSS